MIPSSANVSPGKQLLQFLNGFFYIVRADLNFRQSSQWLKYVIVSSSPKAASFAHQPYGVLYLGGFLNLGNSSQPLFLSRSLYCTFTISLLTEIALPSPPDQSANLDSGLGV